MGYTKVRRTWYGKKRRSWYKMNKRTGTRYHEGAHTAIGYQRPYKLKSGEWGNKHLHPYSRGTSRFAAKPERSYL